MLTLIFIVAVLTILSLGDIIWLEATEAIWNLKQRLPRFRLNFDKRRRPNRIRRDFC